MERFTKAEPNGKWYIVMNTLRKLTLNLLILPTKMVTKKARMLLAIALKHSHKTF